MNKITLAGINKLAADNGGTVIREGRAFFVLLPHVNTWRIYLGDTKERAMSNLQHIITRHNEGEKYYSDLMQDEKLRMLIEDAVLTEFKDGYHFMEYTYSLIRIPNPRRVEFLDRMESEGKLTSFRDQEFGKRWGIK